MDKTNLIRDATIFYYGVMGRESCFSPGGIHYPAVPAPDVIYTFGNGGSSSIADHMACDLMKSSAKPWSNKLRVISLSSNTALLSAISNDLGQEKTASTQICWLARPEDCVVLISSSGKSPNIVKAAIEAKRIGCTLVGLTGSAGGSKGGPLKEYADYSIHCVSEDYGEIEDYHSQVMHEVVRKLKNYEP